VFETLLVVRRSQRSVWLSICCHDLWLEDFNTLDTAPGRRHWPLTALQSPDKLTATYWQETLVMQPAQMELLLKMGGYAGDWCLGASARSHQEQH
jgi:hypothetical protein